MTKKEILRKAIEKAVKNGFNEGRSFGVYVGEMLNGEVFNEKGEITEHRIPYYFQIIFSHSFAKAFVKHIQKEKLAMFLELLGDYKRDDSITPNLNEAWELGIVVRNFLQQMVIEEEPLKYLAKFL